MKQLFLLLLITFSVQVFSQNEFPTYARNDAEWVYDYHGFAGPGITRISYEKDTLIGKRLSKKYGRYRSFVFWGTQDTVHTRSGALFLHEKDAVVELSMNAVAFDTLYDFNARIGKVWPNYLGEGTDVELTDVFRASIDGVSLVSQEIRHTWMLRDSLYTFIDTIYQNLGSLRIYIVPGDEADRAVDGGEGGPLRCYQNKDVGLLTMESWRYQGFFPYPCGQVLTSHAPAASPFQVSAYPNPFSDHIQVHNSENKVLLLDLYDVWGRHVGSHKVFPGKQRLDLTPLTAGIYFLSIEGLVIEKVCKQ